MLFKTFRYIFVPAIALLLTMQIYVWLNNNFLNPKEETKSSGEASIGGAFTLTDQNGEKVSNTDFSNKLMLVYFGFTNCPMICPTDVAIISQAINELGDNAEGVQPIFITIDPERDTPEQIKTFLSNFHPSIIGLTGTSDEIASVANAYRIFYKRAEAEDLQEYLMDHSAYMYLMDKDGKYITHFRHDQPFEEIAAGIKKHL